MNAPTLADFRAFFPEFDSIADPVIEAYLARTLGYLNTSNWGTCYYLASLYYTAHLVALDNNNRSSTSTDANGNVVTPSQAGVTTSASAGGLSQGFSSVGITVSNAWLSRTNYGQQYVELKRTCLPRARISTGNFPCS